VGHQAWLDARWPSASLEQSIVSWLDDPAA
jgi:hypothetical protein